MKAADARTLKVGDWVLASFGIYTKECEITAIDWPTFTLRTADHKGNEMVRTRRYESITGPVSHSGSSSTGWPSWLDRPSEGELSE